MQQKGNMGNTGVKNNLRPMDNKFEIEESLRDEKYSSLRTGMRRSVGNGSPVHPIPSMKHRASSGDPYSLAKSEEVARSKSAGRGGGKGLSTFSSGRAGASVGGGAGSSVRKAGGKNYGYESEGLFQIDEAHGDRAGAPIILPLDYKHGVNRSIAMTPTSDRKEAFNQDIRIGSANKFQETDRVYDMNTRETEENKRKNLKQQVFDLATLLDEKVGHSAMKKMRRKLKNQIRKNKLHTPLEMIELTTRAKITDIQVKNKIKDISEILDSHSDSDEIDAERILFTGNVAFKPQDLSENDYSFEDGDMVYYQKEDLTNFSKNMGINVTSKKVNKKNYWSDIEFTGNAENEQDELDDLSDEKSPPIQNVLNQNERLQGIEEKKESRGRKKIVPKKKLMKSTKSMKGRTVWDAVKENDSSEETAALINIVHHKKMKKMNKLANASGSPNKKKTRKKKLGIAAPPKKKMLPPRNLKNSKSASHILTEKSRLNKVYNKKKEENNWMKSDGKNGTFGRISEVQDFPHQMNRENKMIELGNVKRTFKKVTSDSPYAELLFKRYKEYNPSQIVLSPSTFLLYILIFVININTDGIGHG